jgi:predicted CoA-substrate-specific enzyme activase
MSIVAGIDIGSRTSKGVILNGETTHSVITATGLDMQETASWILSELLKNSGHKYEEIAYIVGTGYGRVSISFDNIPTKIITEISCHGKGAHYLRPSTRTIVEMGGQDCKAIRLDKEGNVTDFNMNDKCAAGTGRFLEIIANNFQIKLEELGPLSLSAEEYVPISSTCTVFAESETISLLARGEKKANIVKGIHHSIANRIAGMFSRVGVESDVFFSGGVAKNSGMKAVLEEVLKTKILTLDSFDPQIVGALGASIFARDLAKKEIKNAA